ncbi:MAG: hydrogen gas-evolving membrane-bound hydrogenase subunit E [Pseudomonadota bacterium]
MLTEDTLSLVILIAFLGATLSFFILPRVGKASGVVAALLPGSLFVAFVSVLPDFSLGEGLHSVEQTVSWVPSLGINLTFRLDGFSLLFSLLITGIGALVALYAGSYFNDKPAAYRGRFLSYILLFMGAMLGTVLSDNLMVMFVFWEMTSLISFLLIGFDSTSKAARDAALQSLVVTAGGGLALFGGLLLVGMEAGTFSLHAIILEPSLITQSPLFGVIAMLVLIGAFTKSAQFPFHFWLPNAMQAPTPASAYLHSATMVKLGVYLLARFDPLLTASSVVAGIIVTVGLITMIVAAVQALRVDGFKAILAYSTVASLGLLVTLIGLDGPVSAVGISGFIVAHALYKAALFFCAGIVIHATGAKNLGEMCGLFSRLPITAVAATLASLSMAGLPPFVGFIAKEYVLEAKLESAFATYVTFVTIMVNTVLVAIAAIVALRPFYSRRNVFQGKLLHGETPGMTTGPALLAGLGVFFGVFADIPQHFLVGPSAMALAGAPFFVSFEIWHGLTPMLGLSILMVFFGAFLVWKWDAIHAVTARWTLLDRLALEKGYFWLFDGLLSLARLSTATFQNGSMRTYVSATIAVVTGAMAYAVLAGGLFEAPGQAAFSGLLDEPLRPYLVLTTALVALGAFVAAVAQSLIIALVAVGLAGYGIAIIFMMNGAPDLALTQFSVETLFVVIVTAILVQIPTYANASTPGDTSRLDIRGGDLLLSLAFALVLFIIVLSIASKPFNPALTEYFSATSLTEAFGRNVVNVILVDFRALDTLGEIAVVAFAAIGVWGLLSAGEGAPRDSEASAQAAGLALPSIIFTSTARFFFVLMMVASLIVLFRGHNEPGGGFIGGLIASAGFAVLALALGVNMARERLVLHPFVWMGTGLVLGLVSGIPGAVINGSFLTHQWADLDLGFTTLKVGTTYIFDIGVYLTVIGGVLAFLIRVQQTMALKAPTPFTPTSSTPFSSTPSSSASGASA